MNTKNILELLKKDHREFEKIISRLEQMSDEEETDEREELFSDLKQKIVAHSKAEEQAFYDRLEREEEAEDLIQEAHSEHEEVEECLEEMESMSPGERGWEIKLSDLKQDLKHHIREEESEVFAKAREFLDQDEFRTIGQEFLEIKAMYGIDEDEGETSRGRKTPRRATRGTKDQRGPGHRRSAS